METARPDVTKEQQPIPRVAVVGCGGWGKNHVRNFAQLRALELICDQDESRLRTQAQLYSGVRSTTSFEEVLGDDRINAVIIATPAARHYTHAKEAILSGKDVFVEKPLAIHYHEGRELVELAEARGAILMVGHILEYHPGVVLLKDIFQSGELGKLWYIYSNRLNLGQVRLEENTLWSLAPHDISVITGLAGAEPTVVSASGGSYLQAGIADMTVVDLLFDDGLRAHIFVSWLHPYKERKVVVIGERKMAVFDDMASEGKLKVYDKRIEWEAGLPVPRQTSETTLYVDGTEPMRLECQHFLTCVQTRERPLTDGWNGLRVLKVLEASQRSSERGGAPVQVSDIEKGVTA